MVGKLSDWFQGVECRGSTMTPAQLTEEFIWILHEVLSLEKHTPSNLSNLRRRALQFHYAPASAERVGPKVYKRMFTNELTGRITKMKASNQKWRYFIIRVRTLKWRGGKESAVITGSKSQFKSLRG